MKYSAIHKSFLISPDELERATEDIKFAMKTVRAMQGVTLQKRASSGPLEEIDHFERSMLRLAETFGIDFGVQWGCDLDLS